jgi:hypothetical protein
MSSVLDQIECPQCGYKQADYEYYCRVGDDVTKCRRCGYNESWTSKRDKEGKPSGWTHQIVRSFGALWYRSTDGSGFVSQCFHSTQELADAESWLRERLAKGDVESQTSYLSRWNSESKQIELAIGQFYDWPETAAPDTHCEQAQEISGL